MMFGKTDISTTPTHMSRKKANAARSTEAA
jgi:hypothetical protein